MGRRTKQATRKFGVGIKDEVDFTTNVRNDVDIKAEPQLLDTLGIGRNPAPSNLSDLRADRNLWHKICVLLYDLHNLAKDHNSERRTLSTVDTLYLSAPYFSVHEAARIKATMLEPIFEESIHSNNSKASRTERISLEDAITSSLANFFEKRRASGDLRPCGPHTLAPVYRRVFGIDRAEIEDARFLSRLRRSGLDI